MDRKNTRHVIALFGASEKGQFQKPYMLHELPQLIDFLGNPPPESAGISFAVQSILYKREVLFFRVREEGFSNPDYLYGFKYLQDLQKVRNLHALCLPGVGSPELLNASAPVCEIHKSPLITSQKDLYDYLTA